MAASRCLSLVPATLLKRCFYNSLCVRSQSTYFGLMTGKLRVNTNAYSLALLPSRNYSTTKTSDPSPSSAKSLADEILKSRLQNEGASKQSSGSSTVGEEESEEDRKKRESSWRAMKYTLIAFGVSFGALGIWVLVECGAPLQDPDGNVLEDEYSNLPVVQQYIYRTWAELNNYNKMIREPSRDKLLPDPLKEPYYQPPYTLVLEMTDILVHPDWTYQTGWRFKKRPGVDFFLSQVGPPLFEVVIYTAEQGFTAYPILDALDPNGYIAYRLFRDATRYQEGHHVKDLDCLNRDLSKVIVVDWNDKSVKGHWRNSVLLPRWKGNDDDATLVDLAVFLRTIATSEVEDVREVLDFYHQFEDPIAAFRNNLQKIQEQQLEQQKAKQEDTKLVASVPSAWKPSFMR